MTLSYLKSQLEELREQARSAQKRYSRELNEIDANESLSNTGKAEAKSRLYESTKASVSGLRDRERGLIESEKATLKARINLTSGSSATDIISFRDAQDRADAIEKADDAARIMARALSSKDTTLAAAIFRRANEDSVFGNGMWTEARRLYTEANPAAGGAIADLADLQQIEQASFDRTLAYGILRP